MNKEKNEKSSILKNIILFIYIFATTFSFIVVKKLSNLDEIWNYNFARAISNGLVPYKDFNMITTPLLPMITGVILKLTKNELIVSRILEGILWSSIFFLTYKIFKKLIENKKLSAIFTFLIALICINTLSIDYNVLVVFITLIILFRELKYKNISSKKQDLITGILAGLTICTKQSVGIVIVVFVVIYRVIYKKDVKNNIKNTLIRVIGVLIPVSILLIYLIATSSLNEFINYAILGIKTFDNSIPYITLLFTDRIEINILASALPFILIAMFIILVIAKKKNKYVKERENIFTLLIYSLSLIILVYPISDKIHFILGSYIALISTFYLIYLMFIQENINKKNINFIFLIFLTCLFLVISELTIENYYVYATIEKNTNIKHYYGVYIDDRTKNTIENIDYYITTQNKNGKNVYILDSDAAVYMIPLDKYNKDYDLFLKGNLGKDGEDGQIEKIKNKDGNEIILIRKSELDLNWQTPTKVNDYIRDNLQKIGEIEIYEIYQ